MALAEPSTLAAALSDQAQRTDGAWRFSSLRKPLGNGMPISNAAGATDSVVRSTLAANGQPAAAVTSGADTKARIATNTATADKTSIKRVSSPATTRLLR